MPSQSMSRVGIELRKDRQALALARENKVSAELKLEGERGTQQGLTLVLSPFAFDKSLELNYLIALCPEDCSSTNELARILH